MNVSATTWKRIGHDAAGVAILALGATATACHDLGSIPDWLRAAAGAALVVSAGLHFGTGQLATILTTVSDGSAPSIPQLEDGAAVIDPAVTTAVEAKAAPVVDAVTKLAHGPLGAIVKADLIPLAQHYGITTDGLNAPALRKAITAAEKVAPVGAVAK